MQINPSVLKEITSNFSGSSNGAFGVIPVCLRGPALSKAKNLSFKKDVLALKFGLVSVWFWGTTLLSSNFKKSPARSHAISGYEE